MYFKQDKFPIKSVCIAIQTLSYLSNPQAHSHTNAHNARTYVDQSF